MEESNMPVGQNEPKGGSAKGIIIGLAILILIAGGYALAQRAKDAEQTKNQDKEEEVMDESELDEGEAIEENNQGGGEVKIDDGGVVMGEVKTFTVEAKNFSFGPAEIKVKKGDKVKITLDNTQGFHDFVIDELDVKTKQFMGPAMETVEFTADKTGTFEFYCSVGEHRKMGMVGKLIVE